MLILHINTCENISEQYGIIVNDKSNNNLIFKDKFCLKLLSEIDNVVYEYGSTYSEITGLLVKNEDFSGGVQALIDLYLTEYGQLSQWLGDNCIHYLLLIAKIKDIHILVNTTFKLPNNSDKIWNGLKVSFENRVETDLNAKYLIREIQECFMLSLKGSLSVPTQRESNIDRNILYKEALKDDIFESSNGDILQQEDIAEEIKLKLHSRSDLNEWLDKKIDKLIYLTPKLQHSRTQHSAIKPQYLRTHTLLTLTEKNRKYILDFYGKIAVLTGDSAIGKSYIPKLVQSILNGDFIPGLSHSLECTNEVRVLESVGAKTYPFETKDILYLLDEQLIQQIPREYLNSMLKTQNRFILITRDLRSLPTLPEQCIYTLTTVKSGDILETYNVPLFRSEYKIQDTDLFVVEDKCSGKALLQYYLNNSNANTSVISSEGNTKLLKIIEDSVEKGHSNLTIVYDRFNASVVRQELDNFKYNHPELRLLYAPWNSFEEAILRDKGYPVSLQMLNNKIDNLELYSEFKLKYLGRYLNINYTKNNIQPTQWWSITMLPEAIQHYCSEMHKTDVFLGTKNLIAARSYLDKNTDYFMPVV